MAGRKTAAGTSNGAGRLRIIGGQWRGRKLDFTAAPGLRPTPDRVRETVFNWLAPDIHGARCLDLFAGSGALGLEALSRGAAHCDFVDSNRRTLAQIERHLDTLSAQSCAVCFAGEAQQFLGTAQGGYDIVFMDPPFGQGLLDEVVVQLDSQQLLNPGALVYLETGTGESLPALPADWELHREKTQGEVCYRLLRLT